MIISCSTAFLCNKMKNLRFFCFFNIILRYFVKYLRGQKYVQPENQINKHIAKSKILLMYFMYFALCIVCTLSMIIYIFHKNIKYAASVCFYSGAKIELIDTLKD